MKGRIRTVKPEAFLDEELWDLEQETGLPIFRGFVGLWTQADREGRFEWRPRALKASILPYWDGDFSRVLDACVTRGFVLRYTVEGREYGLVRSFVRHQVINNREEASALPSPPDGLPESEAESSTSTRAPRVNNASSTREPPVTHADKAEGKGREGKGKEGKGTAREPRVASPPRQSSIDRSEAPIETARRLVVAGYQRRFEAATGQPWMGASAVGQAIDTVAVWCVAAAAGGALEPAVERLLDGVFGAERLAEHRWPLRWVAEDPGRYSPSASAPARFDHVPPDHVPQLADYSQEISDGPI